MKLISILITLNLLFLVAHINGQNDIKSEILRSFNKINSINLEQKDDTDLENFGKAVANSRIVFLGEQDHGDAPTFIAKTRLIKYLHEKMDFDVLVFESDFWALNRVWENQINDTTLINQIRENTYRIWANCIQTQELYSYLNQSLKKRDTLFVSGLDCRHVAPYTVKNYINELIVFTKSQPALMSDSVTLNNFIYLTRKIIDKEYKVKVSKEEKQWIIEYLDKVTANITDPFWKQEFVNLKGGALNSFEFNYMSPIRDIYMAKNLVWLYREKYAGKKIIVWAHSTHNAKNTDKIPKQVNTSMGNEIYKTLQDSIYDLGFTSLTGTAGRVLIKEKYKVEKVKADSFEAWISAMNVDYGFVNFKNINNNTPFYMKGLSHTANKTDWTKIFDGVFYIKNMYPCDKTE